jgi:hypothetical protein
VHFSTRHSIAAAIAVAGVFSAQPMFAQAFTPPAQVGSVTLGWQWVSNTGHFLTDGTLFPRGESVTTSALVEVDYGVTDRFAAAVALPYVFARYTGGLPPFSQLERDSCRCWHSSFQDFAIAGRYRFGDDFWAITPTLRYSLPTHDYPYEGEAVVGRNLQELQAGIHAGWRLAPMLPKASVQAGYSYAVTEKPFDDITNNRSNGYFDFGYAVTRSFYARGGASWQRTHGGLTSFELITTPGRFPQRDRILRTAYWHLTGGAAYSATLADVFVSIEKYVWGRDAHDGIAYTIGTTWYFDLSKRAP